MSLEKKLKTINRPMKLEEIYQFAKTEKYYKTGTLDRKLRLVTQQGYLEPIRKGNVIIGYKPINNPKTPQNGKFEEISLNQTLEQIKSNIKPTWENSEKFHEINKAIKSKFETTKKRAINKYKEELL
jgi:DNA replication protein DnaD